MLLDLVDYEAKACSAIKTFWISGKNAGAKERSSGNKAQGKRSAGTSGDNMDGFIDLVIDIVHANGLTNADILWKSKLAVLPGHFCPSQSWDLLVMNHGKLIAAVKFESLVSASFTKNRNSGCKDVLHSNGSAGYLQAGNFWRVQKTFCGLFEPA